MGLSRSCQRRREALRNRKFLGRSKERTDLHEPAMACQSETASPAGGFPEIDAHPIGVELETDWTPAHRMVLDAQHRGRQTNPLVTSCCVKTGVKGPSKQDLVETHDRRHGPRAAQDKMESEPQIDCCNASSDKNKRANVHGRIGPQRPLENNGMIIRAHAFKMRFCGQTDKKAGTLWAARIAEETQMRQCRGETFREAADLAKPFSKKERETFFERLKQQMPEPKTELVYSNPFTLLIAVVLSAQSTDKSVNKATAALFRVADAPETMVRLGEEGLIAHIRTIGLFRTKAKNAIALSRILIAEHDGKVPRGRAALEALPGVGRKTANVILNVAFGEPVIAVDTHIFRVANRTGLAPGKTPLAVERRLASAVPEKYRLHAHHWLILHGRYTCVARKPKCPVCVVRDLCRYTEKTLAAQETGAAARGRSESRQA
jgi:endonuclease III